MGGIETSMSSVLPEQKPAGFSIEGGGKRFFLDEGEALDSKGEYPGFINFVGEDGKPERFSGGIFDKGDNWQVLRFDGVGGGEYLIPKAGGAPEVKQGAAEGVGPQPAEAPVGGLEDATAVAAMAAAPVEQAAVAGLTPEQVAEDIERTRMGMAAPPDEEVRAAAEEPAAGPESAPEPEIAVAPAEAGRPATAVEARQEFDKEFRDVDVRVRQAKYEAERKAGLEKQAQQLRIEAETARSSVNRLRNKDRIAEAISEEGRLITEAKKLESQAAAITALEDADIRAIEDRRQRDLELTQEVDRWGNLIENPALIEEYRGLDGRMQADLAAAEKLFGGGNPEDQAVLDAARKRIEGRVQTRRTELQAMFPLRFMELAGMAPRQDLGDAAVDYTLDRDLIERYYQFADQFYAELTGQPQAVQAEMPPAPEPVEQPVVETTVEEAMPAAEAVAEPEEVGQPEEVAASAEVEEAVPAPVEEPPAAPVEVPVEASIPGEVVVDEEEKERAEAAKPAEVSDPWVGTAISEKDGKIDVTFGSQTFGGQGLDGTISMLEGWILDPSQRPFKVETDQIVAALSRLNSEKRRRAVPAAPVESAGAVEVPVPAEAVPETSEQRFERRKRDFGGALAGLEQARKDQSGTEGEQRVRLAEAYNQAIGAAMELMEEGEAAKEVVKGFFAGALGTSGGRKLTEVAVRSRMDEAGVLQAATPEERKKKLEGAGLWGLLELLIELGMSFTDKTIGAVVSEVQSATGAGR